MGTRRLIGVLGPMDEAFMSRVAERIAAATEAVSSFSPTADLGNLAAVQTMDEWMAAHSPGTKTRCADCKAPLVEGSTKICIACGNLFPSGLAARREPISFGKSLAKKLFYESVHLEDPQNTSSDDIELEQQPTSSGTRTIANGYSQQQPPSTSRLAVETYERNLQAGERKASVSDASSIPAPAHSLSSKPLKEEDEYIWGSSDADDFGLEAWSQQLARDSGGDPKGFTSADNSAALYSASQSLGQTLSTGDDDFSTAASISADQFLSQSVETDFNVLFPSAPNAVDQSGGEQLANTAGCSVSKESHAPCAGANFHDFFEVSHSTSFDQLLDPQVQEPDPLRQAAAGHSVGGNFDDFFQAASKSTDRSHRYNEETTTPFSGEESSTHSIKTDFDDFFQVVPKSVDNSLGLNVDKPPPHTAEGTSGHKIETDFDDFFTAASGSGDHSRGLNVDTSIPQTTEEFTDQDGETDFDDFLQAAPRSGDQLGGSNGKTAVPLVGEDSSSQREETLLDFFSQSSSESANQSHGPKAEAEAGPHFPQDPSVQNVETDFDFFLKAIPVSGDQSQGQNIQTGSSNITEESSGQKAGYFDDFFQAGHKAGDQDHSQNVESLFPISVEEDSSQRLRMDFDLFQAAPEPANSLSGPQLDTPVTPTPEASNGRDGEADFDDFFQGANVLTGHSRGQNTHGAEPNPAEGSGSENIKTDFDDFFQAAPKSAHGSAGQNDGTDFNYFFETPLKSEGRLPGQHAVHGVLENVEKSNGQIVEPDFDEFFHGASISINHSHGLKGKTGTPNAAEDSVDQNRKTGFPDFFQAASYSVGESNGHNSVTDFDFLKDSPHPTKEVPGEKLSMGFDGFFSTPSHSMDNALKKSETRDFDHFLQGSPWSMVENLEQNETTDLGSGDFDDFVQAAPQSADKVVSSCHTTDFDLFFQGTLGSVDNSQQSLTDFDVFCQAVPQTSDKSSIVETRRQIDFLETSNQLADESHSKKGSMNLEKLLHVGTPRTEALKPPSSSPGFLVHGNGSGQTKAGASPTSAHTEGRSTNGSTNADVLKQLEGLHISQGPSAGYLEPSRQMPTELSDISSRLADHFVISDDSPTNLWSLN